MRSMESLEYRPSYPPPTDLDETDSVNGVFTLLTDCYSPTCTRDKLCYSIACPRRLEQVCADDFLRRSKLQFEYLLVLILTTQINSF